MKTKLITINSNNHKQFYKQYLEIVNPFFNLSNREISVVSLIMYYTYVFRSIEDLDHRMTAVFSTTCKADIRDELDLTKEYFNNLIFRLRKKGILKGNLINSNLYIPIDENTYELKFNFNVSS
jgi:hypothetical protein